MQIRIIIIYEEVAKLQIIISAISHLQDEKLPLSDVPRYRITSGRVTNWFFVSPNLNTPLRTYRSDRHDTKILSFSLKMKYNDDAFHH